MPMPDISDHAVIRYLERVKGVDIAGIREEMRSPALAAANAMGARSVKLGDGCRLVLNQGVVCTVLPKKLNPPRRFGKALAVES